MAPDMSKSSGFTPSINAPGSHSAASSGVQHGQKTNSAAIPPTNSGLQTQKVTANESQLQSTAIPRPSVLGAFNNRQLQGEINETARVLASSWVRPEGSTQVITPVFHRIRALMRLNPQLSQREIANAAGTSQGSISLYLRGRLRSSREYINAIEGKLVHFASRFISGEYVPETRAKPGTSPQPRARRGRPLQNISSRQVSTKRNSHGNVHANTEEGDRMAERKILGKQMEMRNEAQQRLTARNRINFQTAITALQSEELREALEVEKTLSFYQQMFEYVSRLKKSSLSLSSTGRSDPTEKTAVDEMKRARVTDELNEMEASAKELVLLHNISVSTEQGPELQLKQQYHWQRYLLAQQQYMILQQGHILQQQDLLLARQLIVQVSDSGCEDIDNDHASGKTNDSACGGKESSPGAISTPLEK